MRLYILYFGTYFSHPKTHLSIPKIEHMYAVCMLYTVWMNVLYLFSFLFYCILCIRFKSVSHSIKNIYIEPHSQFLLQPFKMYSKCLHPPQIVQITINTFRLQIFIHLIQKRNYAKHIKK